MKNHQENNGVRCGKLVVGLIPSALLLTSLGCQSNDATSYAPRGSDPLFRINSESRHAQSKQQERRQWHEANPTGRKTRP